MHKTFLLTGLLLMFCYTSAQQIGEVVEDLRFIQETLEQVHPSLIDEASVAAFRTYADEIISKVNDDTPDWQVALLAQQLLPYPKDAHTRSDLDTGNSRFLPVSFYWAADGLVVFPLDDVEIPKASEVLQLGQLFIQDLEQKLSELISGNSYWVRASITELLATETILRYLDAVETDDTVSITYRTPVGETLTKRVRPETMTEEMHRRNVKADLPFWKLDETWTKGSVFAWKVEEGNALFSLQTCDYKDEYIEGVKTLCALTPAAIPQKRSSQTSIFL